MASSSRICEAAICFTASCTGRSRSPAGISPEWLRAQGGCEGEGAAAKEPLLSMNTGQTHNLSARYSLRPLFNLQLDEDALYVRLHPFTTDRQVPANSLFGQ